MATSVRVPLIMSNGIARQKNLSSISLLIRYSSSYSITNARQSFPSQRFSANSLFQRHSQYHHPYHALISSRNISNQPEPQSPNGDEDHGFFSFFTRWFKWLIGSVLTFWVAHRMLFLEAENITFLKQVVNTILKSIKGIYVISTIPRAEDVEMVVEDAEEVAPEVEKVADVVEDIAKVVSQGFPEGSPINQAAHAVEHVSDIIAHGAHDIKLIADKIEATQKIMETSIKDAVEAVEELIEHTSKKSDNGEKKTNKKDISTPTTLSCKDRVKVNEKESLVPHWWCSG